MVPISQRPAEVADRAVCGPWEGDLLVAKQGRSFIATLVERQTRYVMLAGLGSDGTTEHVITALGQQIQGLPDHLRRSLTWDQGRELAAHTRLSAEAAIDVYFWDPHSPWQRGSTRTPTGSYASTPQRAPTWLKFSQVEVDHVAAELNARPRQTLHWSTPAAKTEELLR